MMPEGYCHFETLAAFAGVSFLLAIAWNIL